MTAKIRLPRAADIMAVLIIADATGFDLATLVREVARRWSAKHPAVAVAKGGKGT